MGKGLGGGELRGEKLGDFYNTVNNVKKEDKKCTPSIKQSAVKRRKKVLKVGILILVVSLTDPRFCSFLESRVETIPSRRTLKCILLKRLRS